VCHPRSPTGRDRPRAPAGFTLTELIVSVGILVVLLTIIGGVFSLAGRATTQATALMSVHRQLRFLRETLRQDLAGVDPSRSCMAIASKLQRTYETPTDRANGVLSDHRADVLMFFTDTPQRPFVDPADRALPAQSPAQIVYGHANIADIDPSVAAPAVPSYLAPTRFVESTDMNAADWHLARRTILFENVPVGVAFLPLLFLDVRLLRAESDFIIPPWAGRGFDYDTWIAGTGLFDPNPGINNFMQARNARVRTQFFYNGTNSRTLLDPDPPLDRGAQLAYALLPGVADFKVEYTYDDPTDSALVSPTLWLDPLIVGPQAPPGVGRMEWQAGNPNELAPPGPNIVTPADPDRSGSGSPDYAGILSTFGADPTDGHPRVAVVKPRTWPKAIRISMRVYDPRGALAENTSQQLYNVTGSLRPVDLNNNAGAAERKTQYQPIEFVYVHAF
jgi:prepilin-type N-terminal cleavage/methylation domain-containing protein